MADGGCQEKGIDVSKRQGEIDWEEVAKAGIKHVCIKMSEGENYVDPKFVGNWNGAKKSGINVGCYHYFRALSSTPEQQFENIRKGMTAVNFDPAEDILSIDVEARDNEEATALQMADGLKALLNLIKQDSVLSRRPPMIYTSYWYWDSGVKWDEYNFAVYPLWIAHWEAQAPHLPEPWRTTGKTWAWWQHSSKGSVSGISTDVDLDWVNV